MALASQKGGSGKTTLSGHLSVQAQRAGAGDAARRVQSSQLFVKKTYTIVELISINVIKYL